MTGLIFGLFTLACLVAGFCWFVYWEERRNKRLLGEYNDNLQKGRNRK